MNISPLGSIGWPGWKVMELVELCQLPQRPSDILEMREAGVSSWDRLDFDLGCVAFHNRWNREAEALIRVPETAEDKREAKDAPKMVTKRKRTTEWLMNALGLPYTGDDTEDKRTIREHAPSVPPEKWDELWGDEEDIDA